MISGPTADKDTESETAEDTEDTEDTEEGTGSSGDESNEDPNDPQDTGEAVEPAEPLAAEVVSVIFPETLDCDEEGDATITMRNLGSHTWTRADSFKLGIVSDDDPIFDSGDTRVWLSSDLSVATGQTHTFDIPLIGTETEGTAISDWQMVQEGVAWFGEVAQAEVSVLCDEVPALPLPDMSHVVHELAADHPELLADSCRDDGGSWAFLDALVDRLRLDDTRWGYNWKRGVVGDPSEDVVDYHWGSGTAEGSEEVYIIDVIVGHCGDDPAPGWLDQTEATAAAGTIGRWTSRDRF